MIFGSFYGFSMNKNYWVSLLLGFTYFVEAPQGAPQPNLEEDAYAYSELLDRPSASKSDFLDDPDQMGVDALVSKEKDQDGDELPSLAVDRFSWSPHMRKAGDPVEPAANSQFQVDIQLWLSTIFKTAFVGQKVGGKTLVEKHIQKLRQTQAFLQRYIILMALNPLVMVYKNNGTAQAGHQQEEPIPFPFPLASAISHGGRVLMVLPPEVHFSKMFSFLIAGEESVKMGSDRDISYNRHFASHGVSINKNNHFEEEKLLAGITGTHRGIDLPFGGVGNENELGFIIGPTGKSYRFNSSKHVDKYQHGHVYIRPDTYVSTFGRGSKYSTLLIGVESTMPGGESTFATGGKSHDITSGMKDQTLNRSVTGGQKWAPLMGDQGPASYGGLLLVLPADNNCYEVFKQICSILLQLPQPRQQEIFTELLTRNADHARSYLLALPEIKGVFYES
jgi:hypothetical protein